ncbi:hypothetical protein F5Y16DRAFT_375895 [Xylariaceae sp. FL0255]|nr:hypothetical protein F5Y16DRAFT_375895 [Xylariaceae sp. FL0255]
MGSPKVVPSEVLEMQLDQIDLLMAMYPDEAQLVGESSRAIQQFRNLCTGDCTKSLMSELIPAAIVILLKLGISVSDDKGSPTSQIQLSLSVPTVYEGTETPPDPPRIAVRLVQPAWMSKAELLRISATITHEDVLSTINELQHACEESLWRHTAKTFEELPLKESATLVRAWFYFPSISTREKRDDLVQHAPSYKLTGFLFAGKPGILCLEGESRSIDAYMKFIKTESWGDIPSNNKKVSDGYRETMDVHRIFQDMQEVTDKIGERRGERANRGDMKAVEVWLRERGFHEIIHKVLM